MNINNKTHKLVKQAIEKAISIKGSQAALGESIGVKQQAISKMLKKGEVPPRRVLLIEKACNGKVTRNELSPQLYAPLKVA